MSRFLVLGSNSFSGATFCDHVAAAGHEVIATSRSVEPHQAFLPYRWHAHGDAVRFVKLDLNHDLDTLDALLKAEKPTHVVNFAAQSMVGESWRHPEHWMMTNAVSTTLLFERLRRYETLARYVHVTTPEVYGSTDSSVKEDAPFNPTTPYAVSRAAGDMQLRVVIARYGFPAVFTRAANVYGPGQQTYRIIPRTILSAMAGKRLQLHGGGQSIRSFIHMKDASEATLGIALRGSSGETYHISTDRMVSIRELVGMVLSCLGKDFDSSVDIAPDRPGKDQAYRLDSSKLRAELRWQDVISLQQGIDECVAWAETFREHLLAMPSWDYEHKP